MKSRSSTTSLEDTMIRSVNSYIHVRNVSFVNISTYSGKKRGFDASISGSDQVLSPFFLMNGDEKGKVTPAYFLGFPYDGIRIGYALSFGCVTYPEDASKVAAPYVNAFDHLSVREATGVGIVRSMGRKDVELVQDPTLLMNSDFSGFHQLENG